MDNEVKIKHMLKDDNKFYSKDELLEVVKSGITTLTDNIPSDVKSDIKLEIDQCIDQPDIDIVIMSIAQYLYYSKKEDKYYFNTSRRQLKMLDEHKKLVYSISEEYLNGISVDNKPKKPDNSCFIKIDTKNGKNGKNDKKEPYPKTESESDTEVDSEELKKLEEEFFDKYIKHAGYTYPKEDNFKVTKKLESKYGPCGTQWVHDIQKDDPWNSGLERRGKQFDKLRAIELPEQRSEAWFKMRESRITASDGGTVLGQNKYEPQYTFILKKTVGSTFKSNKYCYHGKKLEEIATMIYEYRMNAKVDEFGLMYHPKIDFLAASPDGICNRYKLDGKHKSKFVGRMLEIKCPFTRQIKKTGPIKDNICPIYYWVQVQLQLECCDLDQCDFWQCDIREYGSRNEFIKDTDPEEPFRSSEFGFEKGCLIQLIPKSRVKDVLDGKYYDVIHEDAIFIYPPKIEMTPFDCDQWTTTVISSLDKNPKYFDYVFDKIIYWRLEDSHNVTIERDKKWFAESLPIFKEIWDYVLFLRKNKDKLDLLVKYIDSRPIKRNKEIMGVVKNLCAPTADKKDDSFASGLLKDINKGKEAKEITKKKRDQKIANAFDEDLDVSFGSDYMFIE